MWEEIDAVKDNERMWMERWRGVGRAMKMVVGIKFWQKAIFVLISRLK